MLNNSQYTLVYIDDYVVILVKNKEENKSIIQKYAIIQQSFFLDKTVDKEALIRYIFCLRKYGGRNKRKGHISFSPGSIRIIAYWHMVFLIAGKTGFILGSRTKRRLFLDKIWKLKALDIDAE